MNNKLKSRNNIKLKRLLIAIIILVPIFCISMGYSYLETIMNIVANFTTTDNLNNCYEVEILGQKMSACLDNKKSKYVTSASGINFSNGGSDTNGKGVYIYSSTKDDENPVYYYRGDVTNNNVLFANRCWKIVRTTETGGTKLIYNGVPSGSGSCNNTGTASLLGNSKFNNSDASPSDVGYMYGERYPVVYDYHFSYGKASHKNFDPNDNIDLGNSSNYYYSKTYSYDFTNGKFALGDDAKKYGQWGTAWQEISTGYYTCQSTSSNNCSSLIYVYSGTDTTMNYVEVYKPKKIDNDDASSNEEKYDYFDSSKLDSVSKKEKSFTSHNYYYSKSYTWDGTKYILGDDAEKLGEYQDIANDVFGYYSCLSTTTTSCTKLAYMTDPYSTDNKYLQYIPLSSGRTIEQENVDMYFSESFQKNDDGTYTLVNPVVFKRDQWVKEYSKARNRYKCGTSTETTCSDLYFVPDSFWIAFSFVSYTPIKISSTATWNGTEYTLSGDITTYEDMEIYKDISKISNQHYSCLSTQENCTTLKYLLDRGSYDLYYTELSNGVLLPYETMFPEDSSRNANDSVIKKYIDTNLFEIGDDSLNNYISYLEDTIWCNERSIDDIKGWNPNGGSGGRLNYKRYSDSSIEFTCMNQLDNFTVSSGIGNGALKYPVGLLTSSEVRLAGNSSSSYLNIGKKYWLMTPTYGTGDFYSYLVNDSGSLESYWGVNYSYGVRPSVSLKNGITISSGNGTVNNPYVIE